MKMQVHESKVRAMKLQLLCQINAHMRPYLNYQKSKTSMQFCFGTSMGEEKAVMHKRLEGKVVIITGGASGIGEATARLFAHHGPQKILIADIQDELGQTVASSIGNQICTYIHCDVSEESQVQSLVHHAVETYGRIDILFSNAGIMSPNLQTLLDLDLSAFDRLMSINARGMAVCLKHVAKAMVDGGVKGSIVCTASAVASIGSEIQLDYTMSKHAVLGLVRSASLQLGKYGIRVNCVSPAGVGTPMVCQTFGMTKQEFEQMCAPYTSLKGEVLTVNHVADAVLFLACDESTLITGHNLAVNGGFTSKN